MPRSAGLPPQMQHETGDSASGGNFKNKPQCVSDAGRKGGKASHRSAGMNPGESDAMVAKD